MHPLVMRLSDCVTIIRGDCAEILPSIDGSKLIITSPPYGVGKDYESGGELEWEMTVRRFLRAASESMQGGDFLALNLPDRHVLDEWFGMRPTMPIIWQDLARLGLVYYDKRLWKKDPCWMSDRWHACSVKAVTECEEIYILKKRGHTAGTLRVVRAIRDARDASGLTNKDIDKAFGFNGMAGHWTNPHVQPECPKPEHWEKLKQLLGLGSELDKIVVAETRRVRDRMTDQEWTSWGSRQVWEVRSVRSNDKHPAMFPEELPRRLATLLSNPGDTVCDPFMGSGTTGVACIRTGRRFVGIEKDARYFEIAKQRLEREIEQSLPLKYA